MPAFLLPLLGKIGIKGGAIIALALVAAFLWWRLGVKDRALEITAEKLVAAEAEIELLNTQARLVETAADERVADTDTLRSQERELSDARNHQGDDADTRRIRRLCVVMRQQGRDTDGIAACRGLAGSVGT